MMPPLTNPSIPLLLGTDLDSGRDVLLEPDSLRTHMHLIGATGAGKTTAILTILRSLMLQTKADKAAVFLIDPMGNLSQDLLALIAHPRYSTDFVRDRLVYIEPAREDIVLPFNPLRYTTEANRYYQTMRAVDIVLRAWAAQDVSQQPRLLQWMYKAFCSAAMLGLPIAMCRYLLHPGTEEHRAILNRIPGEIRHHWQEILRARGQEAVRILESTRNRLDPFFESVNLRRMFGVGQNRFDCERFIRDRNIVVLNLGRYGVLPGFIADTIGSLALNEILETASRLRTTVGKHIVDPTYILMDEFQNYVSPDVEESLPTVRQMGLRLIMAHQSFSQLEREDIDLTQMIWQARSRLIFANNARDADIVADELAKLTFDNKTIKDKRTSLRQLITGYRKEWLKSSSQTASNSRGDSWQSGSTRSDSHTHSHNRNSRGYGPQTFGYGNASSETHGGSANYASGETTGQSEANVPIHRTLREVSKITFEPFEEFAIKWGQNIRRLKTGQAFVQLPNIDSIRNVQIDYIPIDETPELVDAVEVLKDRNFASDLFISGDEADREAEQQRQKLLNGEVIVLPHSPPQDANSNEDTPPSGFKL